MTLLEISNWLRSRKLDLQVTTVMGDWFVQFTGERDANRISHIGHDGQPLEEVMRKAMDLWEKLWEKKQSQEAHHTAKVLRIQGESMRSERLDFMKRSRGQSDE